ncbi:kinase-like domain-containing protein [Rhizophagus clarus]|uniref:Kinase-like domain-containing protein n=1 Tax=Rhizophagus clarus TaxID=94130 RepID=A0A8H3M138_9GLOM|nr:kinase-like domain-containing protein [Rhizophagus clarus]
MLSMVSGDSFYKEALSYGNCSDCKRQRITASCCKNCDVANLKGKFYSWTSGNTMIDEFIQYTQLNANDSTDYLEWIDFNQFDLVENTNKESLADYFGMTKDPTLCYMFVMSYYENENLYSYLNEFMGVLCWRDIVDMLWAIPAGLNFITERDLIHGYLHRKNILDENGMDSIDTKIADTGLHGPVDKQISSKQIYGVIPFVAPKIFNGYTLTKESDIYSFGMIMWMLSAGIRPYCDRPHDSQLIQEICSGTNIDNGTPEPSNRSMSARRMFGKLGHDNM